MFIPNPNDLPQVNHKDECKINNCVNNLEWCTHRYNTNYGHRLDKFQANVQPCRGSANPQSKAINKCIKFHKYWEIVKNKITTRKNVSL